MEENHVAGKGTTPADAYLDGTAFEFESRSCFVISKDSKPRRWIIQLIKWPWFERISMFVIVINCVTLAMFNPLDKQCLTTRCQVLENIEHFVFAFFFAEMVIKMVAMGIIGKKGYLQDKWNRLDCFIVIIGLIEKAFKNGNYLTIIRACRVLRPLRAINKVPSIRILVTLLLDTLPMLGNVLLLSFLIFFVFGIISVQLWQGKLKNRCFTNFNENSAFFTRYNQSVYYQPSFNYPDFVCSLPEDHGTSKCSDIDPYHDPGNNECHGSFENNSVTNNSVCVNWNKYYISCRPDGRNPFYGTTSFDNIGIAWIAIFQVITLEGWSDIMYFVQDAHSFWNWIYFVVLIVMGSFFLVNLCLVVITMQFQETKAREIELMENSKDDDVHSSNPLTIFSRFIHKLCNCTSQDKEPRVHHHHHHFYHHHHFHHHMYNCFVPSSPGMFSNVGNDSIFALSSDVPKIKIEGGDELSFSSSPDESEVQQECLGKTERTSRRSSKTSVCSHTLSIHAETSSAVSIEEIVAQANTSVTLNLPSPTTSVGFFAFASSNSASRKNSGIGKTEVAASTTVSAEINPQYSSVSSLQEKQNESTTERKEERKSSIRRKDKDLLKYRRFSQPAHVKLTRTSSPSPSKYSPSEIFNEDTNPRDSRAGEINPEHLQMDEILSSPKRNAGKKDKEINISFQDFARERLDDDCQTAETTVASGKGKNPLSRRTASSLSEDDMFESLFNLGQSASYDVTINQGVWQRFRALCRKITVSKQFTFLIMGVILLNMICMGLEHYEQPDSLTVALETTNIIFVSIFGIEMIIKLVGDGVTMYLSKGQNVFDGTIVIVSVCEILLSQGNSALSIFRSVRLLRIFKLVRPVRYQLLVVVKTMTSVMTFFGLLFLFIFAFAILGMNLFGGKFNFPNAEGVLVTSRSNFDNFLWAMVSVFQILTQENWNRVMYDGMRATNKWAALYFTALMAVGYYVLFNLLVAILVEGFTNSGKQNSSPKNNIKTGKPFPDSTTVRKPHISISYCNSQDQETCPGSNYQEAMPNFCGHGVRNSLGTTFKMKSNFTPNLDLAKQEPTRGKNNKRTDNSSHQSQDAPLTLSQLKRMRQASMSIIRRTGRIRQNSDRKFSACNPAFGLGEDSEKKNTANRKNYQSEKEEEASPKRASKILQEVVTSPMTEVSDSPCHIDRSQRLRKLGTSSSPVPVGIEPCQVQVQFQSNNSVYQQRESDASPTKIRTKKARTIREKRQDWSLYLLSPSNRLRRLLIAVCEHKYFDYVVLFFILTSCVILALEEPNISPDHKKRQIIDISMVVLTGIFSLEMMMKIVAHGFVLGPGSYLKDGWNVLDGSLVVISWIDVIFTYSTASAPEVLGALRVFRALRTLRPLRMIRRAPGLKLVVQTLLYSLKPIGNTVLIAAIFFAMFAILGVQIFKGTFHFCEGNNHVMNKEECLNSSNGRWENHMYNFDNLPKALISLFVFSTRDGWVEIMHNGIDAVGIDQQPIKNYAEWRLAYFIPFLMLGGFLVLNMIVGVVVENFQRCRERLEDEEKQRSRKKLLEKARSKNQQDVDRTYYESYNKWRRCIHDMCLHMYWDVTIAMVICLNVICMSLEHYQMSQTFEVFVETSNYIFTGVFVLEAIFKFIAFGFLRYFKDRWNLVDLVIVILSLAGIIIESLSSTRKLLINPTVGRSLRVLRIIRVLKLVKLAKGVRSLLDTLFEALPQVANLGLLFLLLFFIYSCLGIQLFGTLECSPSQPCQGLGPHAHFRDFGNAMLTLFRIATGDNWNGILEDTLRSECSRAAECEKYCCMSKYTAPLFFVTFVLAAQFVLVNVVIAVLMKHLKESKEKIAANMAAKDLEKKLKLLTLTAKNFIKGKTRKNELPPISRRRSIMQLGLGGIELAQLKNCEPEKTIDKSFCAEFARADAIFQEFLRLNANLQKVKMTIVRTSSHDTVQVTPSIVTHAPRPRRNSVSGIRELRKTSSHLSAFTVYKSGAKL